MAALPWITYLQRMVGRGHPTLADTLNTPLRTVLSQSGYDPDASPFPGLLGPVFHVNAFGAIGGGTGDQGPAIQAAYDAMPSTGGLLVASAENFRIATTVTFSTKRVQFLCGGRAILSSSNAGTRFIKASSLNGPAFRIAGGNSVNGSVFQGFMVDGEGGNGGDGIALETNYCTLRDITVTNQGRDGFRIGGAAAENANLWRLDNCFALANGRHGLLIDDPAGGGAPNTNAGTVTHFDASTNGGDGVKIGNSRFSYFFNVTAQTNVGAGIRLTSGAFQNAFFGGDIEEANAGGNLVVEAGATENGFLYTDVTTGITDAGTGTYFLFRRGRINRLAFRNINGNALVPFADGDTTPSIAAGSLFNTSNTTPTAITYFDDGVDGDFIVVKLDNQTGITHNNGFIRLQNTISLPTGAPTVWVDANVWIAFIRTSGVWFEVFRSKSPIIENSTGPSDLNQLVVSGGFRQSLDGWYQENVAASQTDVVMTRLATSTEAPAKWIAPRAGSVTGVWVKANTPRTAGTLTIKVFRNGAQLGTLTAVLDGANTTFKATTLAKDTITFVAGDELETTVTTDAGWLPVTADIRTGLEVET